MGYRIFSPYGADLHVLRCVGVKISTNFHIHKIWIDIFLLFKSSFLGNYAYFLIIVLIQYFNYNFTIYC